MNINQPSSLLPVPSGTLQIPESPSQELVWFSLIIPTYNEAANIEKLIQRLTNLLDERIPGNYELIVVDDNSPDGTWQIAQSLIQKYPQLQVMRRQDERGLSSAVIRGWQVAKGTILGVIDGDLQHPPHVLLQLLDAIIKGADLAVASRHIDGGGVSSWSLIRSFFVSWGSSVRINYSAQRSWSSFRPHEWLFSGASPEHSERYSQSRRIQNIAGGDRAWSNQANR